MTEVPNPNRLFVYGTLRLGGSNNQLLQGARFIGTGTVAGTLHRSGSLPMAANDPSRTIYGEVYEVNDASQWSRLDSLEGHPCWYCREVARVKLENGPATSAWVYWMPDLHSEANRTEIVEDGDYIKWRQEARGF